MKNQTFYKHSLVIGLNDKDTKKQVIKTSQAINIIADIVGDCTIKQGATGFYTHEDGTKVKEKSLNVEIFNTSKNFNMLVAKQIKQALNQESIIINSEKSKAKFI